MSRNRPADQQNAREPTLTRRTFLKRAAMGAGAAFAFPTIVPSSVFGANAPSNRIVLGAIGLGNMGTTNMKGFLGRDDVQFVAVCDVDRDRLEQGRATVNQHYGTGDCTAYADFRDLIAHPGLDAVSIATPDHWHAVAAITAACGGLDIYGEKPFSHDLKAGRAMCDAVSRYGRVWQTGSWQRSENDFHIACELVRNGRIGKVHTVEVGLPDGHFREDPPVQDPPPQLDWNRWLGPAPWTPYRGVAHWDWRWVLAWGGGQMLDWIGHHADIAHWGLALDRTGPISVEGSGEFPGGAVYDAPIAYRFTCRYASGVEMIVANSSQQPMNMGTRWIGDQGWIWVSRGGFKSEPAGLIRERIGPGETRLTFSRDHRGNFIECVRNRQITLAPAEISHRSASVGHLGQIAMLTGRRINWDPDSETIIDDPGASALLGRACRQPWTL
jgi:predicted dehydrogenase